MLQDFLDAHQRHWSDAEPLFEAARWAGADHLYGIDRRHPNLQMGSG